MLYWITLTVVATIKFSEVASYNSYPSYGGVPTYSIPSVASSYGSQGFPPQGGYTVGSIKGSLASPKVNVRNSYYVRNEEKDNSGVKGYNATLNQFPFQVSIRINGLHACGGAIVSPMAIITTAHCVAKQLVTSMTVLSGTIDREKGGVQSQVSKYVVHPNYNEHTKAFDVAIVFLKGNLKFNATIHEVQLPKKNEEIYAHSMVTISGWGGESRTGRFAKKLKYIYAPLMDHEVCKSHFPVVGDTMICVGELFGQRFSCPGDAGGPLTKGNLLIGLLSWGYECGVVGKPTVFTYVAGVRDWIRKIAMV